MLWLRKGVGFASTWTECEQNRLLSLCFGLAQVNKSTARPTPEFATRPVDCGMIRQQSCIGPRGVGASSRRKLGRVARLRLSRYGLGHAVQAQCRTPSLHPEDPLSG